MCHSVCVWVCVSKCVCDLMCLIDSNWTEISLTISHNIKMDIQAFLNGCIIYVGIVTGEKLSSIKIANSLF